MNNAKWETFDRSGTFQNPFECSNNVAVTYSGLNNRKWNFLNKLFGSDCSEYIVYNICVGIDIGSIICVVLGRIIQKSSYIL